MLADHREGIEKDALSDLGEAYHVASRNQAGTKHLVNQHLIHYSDAVWELSEHAPMKRLDALETVAPPGARIKATMSVEEAIACRRSNNEFDSQAISYEQLATLLYLGNSIQRTDVMENGRSFKRTAANSGNLGSIETYPVVLNVHGLRPGIYHFNTIKHELSCLRHGDFEKWLRLRVFYQLEFSQAAVAVILTAAVGRLCAKYGARGYRLVLIDAGVVAGQMYLVAPALGLDVCATAGFIDDELDAALGLDGLEVASVLVVLIGPRRDHPPAPGWR